MLHFKNAVQKNYNTNMQCKNLRCKPNAGGDRAVRCDCNKWGDTQTWWVAVSPDTARRQRTSLIHLGVK